VIPADQDCSAAIGASCAIPDKATILLVESEVVNSHISQHRLEIESLCRDYGVTRLEVFGSAARGDFDPAGSDFDFFVEFADQGWKGSFKRYMGLKLALEDLLQRPVDLVEPAAATNPYFLEVANRYRELVYAA
jgi:uncharacterized protein